MLSDSDNFYYEQQEPLRSYLLALKEIILNQDPHIKTAWKYNMPFFCYNEKMFCYLWIHKKLHLPYLGIVEGNKINHPDLLIEKRSRMKILLLDPSKDIPVKKIQTILKLAISFY